MTSLTRETKVKSATPQELVLKVTMAELDARDFSGCVIYGKPCPGAVGFVKTDGGAVALRCQTRECTLTSRKARGCKEWIKVVGSSHSIKA